MIQPMPMDVDKVNEEKGDEEQEDLDAVGQGVKCYNCQGYGHFADTCPSPYQYNVDRQGEVHQSQRREKKKTPQDSDNPNSKGGQVRSPDTPL